MDLGYAGKRCLVTASTGGLGFAIAECMAAEGADIVVNGRAAVSGENAVVWIRGENAVVWIRGEVEGAKIESIVGNSLIRTVP
jgi:3-oxoacyl-[acyl-carrier protein] reductase